MDNLLIMLFGTSKTDELALPMFIVLIAVAGLIFWIALTIGRRRQRRLIDGYDSKMRALSKQLRQKSSNMSKQR